MNQTSTFEDRDGSIIGGVVSRLVACEVQAAEVEAAKVLEFATAMRVALAQMAHRPRATQEREMRLRSIAAEIGVALRWPDRTVQNRMSAALTLVESYPATLDELAAGRISARHAAVISDAGAVFDDPVERAAFETVVLERALSDTVARTDAYARRIAEEMHPESITERFHRAEQNRRTWVEELGDGMGQFSVIDSITKIRAIHDRTTQQARAIATANRADKPTSDPSAIVDIRTLDQIRADLTCDMLLTGQPAIDPTVDVLPGGLGAIRAKVSVVVPAMTAAGVSDRGASIDGLSPIDAETARCLMAGAPRAWDRILTDPATGAVLHVGSYPVNPAIRRFLAARDIHCRFPGCRQPARRCDHDHNIDWAKGGETDACNLALLCKRHHTLKTETEWAARQRQDGSIVWTTPLGRTTLDVPEKYPKVAFVPEPDPPPY